MITRTSVSQQQVADLVIGRRAFSACWLSAGFGLTILQLLLLARGWRLGQDALVPALLASAWALGSLLAARMGRRPRLWGVGCLACVLFWLSSPVPSGWRLPETLGLPPVLADSMALALQAVLLGMCGTAWLAQQRAWPVAGEKTTLVRSLVGLTVGLLVAWMLPAVGGLMALVCCLPLLALDAWLSGRAPLPPPGGVAARWRDRYWNAGGWSMQLERRSPLRSWHGPSQRRGSEKARGTLPLALLASPLAVVLGSVWGAVPTSFGASLHASHNLGVLCWLLGGQIVALAVGAFCLLAARNGIGFPARLLPLSWQPPMRGLALLMPLAMAVSLAALGAPALQARWWLALSLAGYTLADAVWCTLLPRLRPDLTTVARSQSHLLLPAQDARLADPFHLAHARACEARAQLLQVRVEGVAIIVCAPLLGWLIDRLGSVDAVLVLVGLAFALGLLCAALAWMFIRVIRAGSLKSIRGPAGAGSVFPAVRLPGWRQLPFISTKGKDTSMEHHFPSAVGTAERLIPAQGHGRRFLRRKRLLLAVLADVIEGGATSGKHTQGQHVAALERLIEERWQVGAAVAVNSGSSALRLALESLRLEKGREVIVPALTFISTAFAVSDAGLVPVFVDIDPQTLTLDPDAAQSAMNRHTAALLPVHLYGQMADMLPLLDLADTYGLFVIEDAAQAHGATYGSTSSRSHTWYAGSLGDLGCFSLNGVKNMGGLGDGGLVTVSSRLLGRDRTVADRLRGMRDLGRYSHARYQHDGWGLRARLDEFTAAECLLEFAELEVWNARRRVIADRYHEALAHSVIRPPVAASGRGHVYFNYAVQSPSVKVRERFEQHLRAAGIEVAERYTLVCDQGPYRTGKLPCRAESLEVAREIVDRITHIPLYPELEDEEIERIMNALRQFVP